MLINSRRLLATVINAVLVVIPAAKAQQNPAAAGNEAREDSQSQAAAQAGRFQARRQQQQRFNAFAQALNLTEDQKRQLIQIERETGQSVWAARRDTSLSEDDKQQKIKEIHSQQRQKLVALLTPEQQQALKRWNEEQRLKQSGNASDSAPGQKKVTHGDQSKANPGADDDFFAGMVQDLAPPVQALQKNQKPPENR